MKTKGITIWEQRAEFFVIGLVLVVLVVYLVGQLSSPNIEQVGRDNVGPGDWHDKLKETASDIKKRQESQDIPPAVSDAIKLGQQSASVDLQEFRGKLMAAVGPEAPSQLPGYRVVPKISGAGSGIAANAKFVEPDMPAPTKPVVYQTFDLLAQGVVEQHAGLEEIVETTPHDITWLTVASEFNIAEALRRFEQSGPNGESPLPSRWHGDRIDLLDVRLERSELVDGTWTDAQIIAVIPDQISFRDRLAKLKELDASDRDEILASVIDASVSRQIYQPDFYPTVTGNWVMPVDYVEEDVLGAGSSEGDEASGRRRFLLRRLKRLETQRDALKDQMGRGSGGSGGLSGGGGPGGGGSGGKGPGGGGGRGPGGGGAGGGLSGGGSGGASGILEARLKRLQDQIDAIQAELAEDQAKQEADQTDGTIETDESLDAEPELLDTRWIWGYDIQAHSGSTYRYRVTLVVYNPLFARKLSLVEEQQHLAESLVTVVDSSEWSDPVTVMPPLQILAVRAVPSGQAENSGRLGYGEATAEVWRFHGGRWWPRKFPLQPGDSIGHLDTPENDDIDPDMDPLNFATEWYVVDVVPSMGATRSDTRLGRGAKIVIQKLDGSEVITIDPRVDSLKPKPDQMMF